LSDIERLLPSGRGIPRSPVCYHGGESILRRLFQPPQAARIGINLVTTEVAEKHSPLRPARNGAPARQLILKMNQHKADVLLITNCSSLKRLSPKPNGASATGGGRRSEAEIMQAGEPPPPAAGVGALYRRCRLRLRTMVDGSYSMLVASLGPEQVKHSPTLARRRVDVEVKVLTGPGGPLGAWAWVPAHRAGHQMLGWEARACGSPFVAGRRLSSVAGWDGIFRARLTKHAQPPLTSLGMRWHTRPSAPVQLEFRPTRSLRLRRCSVLAVRYCWRRGC
jgi:hypothetical protein